MGHKLWTKEQVEFLEDQWGTKSIEIIAKTLGKSENAIILKAGKIGLGSFLENGDYITVKSLLETIGYVYASNTINSWIKKGFPYKYKKVNKGRYRVVNIEDFWKWAYKNQHRLDFSKFVKFGLGKEPSWVKDKRESDINKNQKTSKNKSWTKEDDEYLIYLLNQFQYSRKEISRRMLRSENAIEGRILKLNLKQRPVKAYNKNSWTDEEKETLKNMMLNAKSYEEISYALDLRSVKSIKGYCYRTYGTEITDKIREIIKSEK